MIKRRKLKDEDFDIIDKHHCNVELWYMFADDYYEEYLNE